MGKLPATNRTRLLSNIRFFSYRLSNEWFSEWLCTPREDGKPRVLVLQPAVDCEEKCASFIEHLKKVFKLILEKVREVVQFLRVSFK
jgi:hypothetical protein